MVKPRFLDANCEKYFIMLLIPTGKGRFLPPVTNADNEPGSVDLILNNSWNCCAILRASLLTFQ